MKLRMSSLLCLVVVVALLAGCTGTPAVTPAPATAAPATAAPAPAATAAAATAVAPAATPAATPAPAAAVVNLKYWTPLAADKLAPLYTNYSEAPFWSIVEKATNVHITFIHPTAGQEKDQFNLLVASRDLPDIFERDINVEYPGGAEKAIADGIIIKLNDVINKSAPNMKKVFTDHPDWDKMAKTDEGSYFAFPFIRSHDQLLTSWGSFMRKDYLDKIGFTGMPETIADWYKIAQDMKAAKLCEFPFMPVDLASIGDSSIVPGAWDVGWEWYVDKDGQYQYGPLMPQYKDFIAEMAKWYKEGLMNPDFVAKLDEKTFRANVMDGKAGIFFRNLAGGMGWLYDNMKVKENNFANFRMVGVPYPVANKGDKSRYGNKALPVASLNWCITGKCADVDAAARWLDYGYSAEGNTLFNFGIEGESFKWVDSTSVKYPLDMTTLGAKFPQYTEIITNNPKQPMSIAMSPYIRAHMSGNFVQDIRYLYQFLPYQDQLDTLNTWTSCSDYTGSFLPRIFFTTDESKRIAQIGSEVNTYRDEQLTAFITGKQPMTNWDTFVNGLKSLKIEENLQLRRTAYQRAISR